MNDIDALGCDWFYQDYDGDGYGVDNTGTCQCHGGWSMDATVGGDCDDYADDAYPGGQEICGDSVDQDCDGADGACASMSLSNADVTYYGDTFQDQAGAHIVRAGDLNNDGYDDLLYGSPHATNSSYGYGDAYVGFGPLTSGTYVDSYYADVNFFGEDYGDWAGMAVASIGDNNGDGHPDIALTAPRDDDANYNAGAVYIIHGPLTSGINDLMYAPVKVTGEGYEDQIGITIAAAGDINDDGYADLWIGAPKRKGGPPSAGTAYLMHGPVVSGSVTNAVATLTGVGYADHAGSTIVSGQDLDGDGVNDTLIGAPGNDEAFDDAGAVYIFLGKVKGTKSLDEADIIIYGEAEGDQLGSAIDFAGDVDGDGQETLKSAKKAKKEKKRKSEAAEAPVSEKKAKKDAEIQKKKDEKSQKVIDKERGTVSNDPTQSRLGAGGSSSSTTKRKAEQEDEEQAKKKSALEEDEVQAKKKTALEEEKKNADAEWAVQEQEDTAKKAAEAEKEAGNNAETAKDQTSK